MALSMRRIVMMLTVVAMVVAMMVVMAGTASAQAKFLPSPCFPEGFPAGGRDETGTVLLVPGKGNTGLDGIVCTGRPLPAFEPTS